MAIWLPCSSCQIPQVNGNGANSNDHCALAAGTEGFFNEGSNFIELFYIGAFRHLPDQYHVALADAQNKIVLAVREEILKSHPWGRTLLFSVSE